MIFKGTRVEAKETINEVTKGDTGYVSSAWLRQTVCVTWYKDGKPRPIHRKRLRIL